MPVHSVFLCLIENIAKSQQFRHKLIFRLNLKLKYIYIYIIEIIGRYCVKFLEHAVTSLLNDILQKGYDISSKISYS